jgi:hypothetical protein
MTNKREIIRIRDFSLVFTRKNMRGLEILIIIWACFSAVFTGMNSLRHYGSTLEWE